ncbi:hypothetical protein TrCOL_g4606 [Triparma columacea]|uniref:Uncharacterized protein n=1 Tax=Triparma columacea TaxID=722753 RepID=A0A9W7L2N3_9STRA|nr:hypothetical protein TrCOL_g4606 [Triparma columacea]
MEMQMIWGILLLVVGLGQIAMGITKMENSFTRLMTARSAQCWGEENKWNAQIGYGCLVCVFGLLLTFGVIPSKESDGYRRGY